MIWRWVIGILAVLTVLLCFTRAGVLISLGDTVVLDVRVGWLRFRILPAEKRRPEKKASGKARKKEKKEGEAPAEKRTGRIPRPDAEDIRSAFRALAPPLKKALARTRRGIRIHPLCLHVAIGGKEDPAAAAELYGEMNAGIWSAMPVLERLLDIPEPHICTDVDFDAEETKTEGAAGVSIRIGTVLAVGLGLAFPALGWFLRYIRKHRKKRSAPGKTGVRAA